MEIEMLTCESSMKPDQKKDDIYLCEDPEPKSIYEDSLQSMNRPKIDFGQGKTYTV